ncbi:PREDICTED: poly(U)-specific endoribonuclease-like [Priapulus caudatus]|uniref:Uridylate-specific endoribonuclease n=1 Tax=Priapulus caudatus TaxID=37621 RepID=A0ABM1EG44_PRICU|nr:PREDICTED: poly(U)-specific endoribonuclease-like [Priapulus caudatus]
MFTPNEKISQIVTKLWNLDENRLEPGKDYDIDLQGYTKVYRKGSADYAREPLFTFVNEEEVFERETYNHFRLLLNNYTCEAGVSEEVTPAEMHENQLFIDAIMETDVMKEAHRVLVDNEKASEDEEEFKQQLYDLWFKLYRRTKGNRSLDSSGFEHVFVGETRGEKDVIGFHNWIQFYLQEKLGHVDYLGYIPRGTPRDDVQRLISIQFSWNDSVKPVGSSFIGTSPEFEVALYTVVCLLSDDYKTPICIDGQYEVEICCQRWGRNLGAAYPVAQ